MRTLTGFGLFLVACTALPTAASAQGIFLEQGKDAFSAGLSFAGGGGASATSLGLGYSFGGVIDAGVAVHRYRFDDFYYLYNPYQISGTGLSLYSNVLLARQDAALPVSVGATAGFQKMFFSSNLPRLPGESAGGWAASVGAFACRRFDLTDRITATPQLTLALAHGSFSHTAGGYGRYSASGESLIGRADAHLAYKDGSDRLWIVTPFLGFGDYSSGSGLAIGGVFP